VLALYVPAIIPCSTIGFKYSHPSLARLLMVFVVIPSSLFAEDQSIEESIQDQLSGVAATSLQILSAPSEIDIVIVSINNYPILTPAVYFEVSQLSVAIFLPVDLYLYNETLAA